MRIRRKISLNSVEKYMRSLLQTKVCCASLVRASELETNALMALKMALFFF